ncbi:MAG: hypothetical protein HDS18_06800 [Bacteroides sp.]|nr:hypothetical protein [Bacteroidales bacterium]MBD5304444.1 hypothetical protein [Bacteroides sp.]MBD5340026.1 hypothetical protein [Bacteroides sp.]
MLNFRKKKEEATVQDELPVGVEESALESSEEGVVSSEEDSLESGEEGLSENEEVPCGITDEFRIASEAFAKGKGLELTDVEKGINLLQEIGEGWRDGELTVEMLEIALRGLQFERAVAEAREAGEIAGRNLQIDEKYMHPVESDGIPHLGGSNARRSAERIASIFDLARNA